LVRDRRQQLARRVCLAHETRHGLARHASNPVSQHLGPALIVNASTPRTIDCIRRARWAARTSLDTARAKPRQPTVRKQQLEMHSFTTNMRVAGLFAALVRVAGTGTASARPHNPSRHETESGLLLTYTKWFAPDFPNMVGTVGGDINGQ